MEGDHRWNEYYENTKDNPPAKLLVEALKHVSKGEALDLGAGTAKDASFLLKNGFDVTAVDESEFSEMFLKPLSENSRFHFIRSKFEALDIPRGTFDVISAQKSLPFMQTKKEMLTFITKVIDGLKTGGVFTAQLFGSNDSWAKEGKKMAFVSIEEIKKVFKDLNIIVCKETEREGPTASSHPHHWHIIEVIVQK